jgi:hypothetical protein
MVDSREKGARAETVVKEAMRKLTGLPWERTPGSGALDPKHMLKGDLYVPNRTNLYCVEIKHYAEDHLTSKVLTGKNPQLFQWWDQCVRQAIQMGRKPLLIFKHDRSKLFAAYMDFPNAVDYIHMYINYHECHPFYVATLEDLVKHENPKFVS